VLNNCLVILGLPFQAAPDVSAIDPFQDIYLLLIIDLSIRLSRYLCHSEKRILN
jgi:hypothetical protein